MSDFRKHLTKLFENLEFKIEYESELKRQKINKKEEKGELNNEKK